MSLALGGPGSQPVDLAEELPLVGELDILDGESSSLLVRSHLDATGVVGALVHQILAVVAVEDPRPRAAADGSLQEDAQTTLTQPLEIICFSLNKLVL